MAIINNMIIRYCFLLLVLAPFTIFQQTTHHKVVAVGANDLLAQAACHKYSQAPATCVQCLINSYHQLGEGDQKAGSSSRMMNASTVVGCLKRSKYRPSSSFRLVANTSTSAAAASSSGQVDEGPTEALKDCSQLLGTINRSIQLPLPLPAPLPRIS